MVRIPKLLYVTADFDRYGNVRYYFRRPGRKKVRLPGPWGSREFQDAYALALGAAVKKSASVKDLEWLCDQYYRSPAFKHLSESTRDTRKRHLKRVCAEKVTEGSSKLIGSLPFVSIPEEKIIALRDRLVDTPGSALDRLKSLRGLFKWAVAAKHMKSNPSKGIEKIKYRTDGHHTWTIGEVRQYEATHHVGTKPRLALALLLYTGQRRSDIVRFGPQHVKNGWLNFTQKKNSEKAGGAPVSLSIPVLPELQQIIDATPCIPTCKQGKSVEALAFLVTYAGRPHTAKGFGNTFRQWCNEAKLYHCSAHGLRKAGATIAAENGASAHQLMAIFGWEDIKQAELYTRKARQKKIAGKAMHLLRIGEG